jgi:hypothetical protein
MPTNRASCFRITNSLPRGDDFLIEWPAVSGRVYSAMWSTNLTTGFLPLESGIDYPRHSCTDTVHASDDQCFYHVEVRIKQTGGHEIKARDCRLEDCLCSSSPARSAGWPLNS